MTNIATHSAALVGVAIACDRTAAKAEPVKQAWAVFAASSVMADGSTVTIDDVQAALIAAARDTVRSAKGKEAIKSLADVSQNVSSTLAGWMYDLKRVHKNGLMGRLIAGESLTTLRRGTDSTTANKGRKGGAKPASQEATSDDATPVAPVVVVSAPSSFEEAAKAFIEACERADVVKIAKASQGELGRAIAAGLTLTRAVEAHIAAKATAKASKPARQRKAKAA